MLPFHTILYYCDSGSGSSALCISTVYTRILVGDVVKSFAAQDTQCDRLCRVGSVPVPHRVLYLKTCTLLGEDVSKSPMLMIWTCEEGDVDVMNFLMSKKAPVTNARAISTAILNSRVDVLKIFISNGLDLTNTFCRAIAHDKLDVVEFLIDTYKEECNLDAGLQWACGRGRMEMAKYLVSLGANVGAWRNLAVPGKFSR